MITKAFLNENAGERDQEAINEKVVKFVNRSGAVREPDGRVQRRGFFFVIVQRFIYRFFGQHVV